MQGGTKPSLTDKYKSNKKRFCTKLVNLQDYTQMHGQQNIKPQKCFSNREINCLLNNINCLLNNINCLLNNIN